MYFQTAPMQASQQTNESMPIIAANIPAVTSTHTLAQNLSSSTVATQNGDISLDMSWLDVPFWINQSTSTTDIVAATASSTPATQASIAGNTVTNFHGGAMHTLPSNALTQHAPPAFLDPTRSLPHQTYPVCQQNMLYAENARLAMVNSLPLHPLQSNTVYVKQEQQQQQTQSYWLSNSPSSNAYHSAPLVTTTVSMTNSASVFDETNLFSANHQKQINVCNQASQQEQQFGGSAASIDTRQHQPPPQQAQQQSPQQSTFSPVSPFATSSTVDSLVVKSSVSEPLVAYPDIYGNRYEARKRNKSMSWLDSQPVQPAGMPGSDYTHSKAPPVDWHHIQNDPEAMPRPQKPRYQKDDYSPKWVRYSGHLKEGYCDTCVPGKWLQLKNSAYWYHKQFFHGISSVSGQHFAEPLEQRVGENDIIEGLCHQCGQFVPVCNGRRKNNLLWYRHAHKCHVYDKPAKYIGSASPSTSQKQPIYPVGMP